MTDRQQYLFRLVVEIYIQTAEPVSSSMLRKASRLNVSPATIRNDMAQLEAEGLLMSPHTSAGKIPTDKGYRFYIIAFQNSYLKKEKEKQLLKDQLEQSDHEQRIRRLAKKISELTGETVAVSLSPEHSYKFGISQLISKPEFKKVDKLIELTEMIDDIDCKIATIELKESEDVKVTIGKENPFGEKLTSMTIAFKDGDKKGIICIIGSTRMNYKYNLTLLREVRKLLK